MVPQRLDEVDGECHLLGCVRNSLGVSTCPVILISFLKFGSASRIQNTDRNYRTQHAVGALNAPLPVGDRRKQI